jgi:hypothetical protein
MFRKLNPFRYNLSEGKKGPSLRNDMYFKYARHKGQCWTQYSCFADPTSAAQREQITLFPRPLLLYPRIGQY